MGRERGRKGNGKTCVQRRGWVESCTTCQDGLCTPRAHVAYPALRIPPSLFSDSQSSFYYTCEPNHSSLSQPSTETKRSKPRPRQNPRCAICRIGLGQAVGTFG